MPSSPLGRRGAALVLVVGSAVVGLLLMAVGPGRALGLGVPAPVASTPVATATTWGNAAADAEVPPIVDPSAAEAMDPQAAADLLAGVLPGEVPTALSGALVVMPGSEAAPGTGTATSVRVEVEEGLPVDETAFARFVMDTLNDPRGWGADGSVTFARTDGAADIRVVLASPATVDAMCAPLATNGKWSCGRYGHAAINAQRWASGSDAFNAASGTDLLLYRQYLVNHEVGHLLGHQHTGCPAAGATAPVMLQQSLGLGGCVPNGWPSQ